MKKQEDKCLEHLLCTGPCAGTSAAILAHFLLLSQGAGGFITTFGWQGRLQGQRAQVTTVVCGRAVCPQGLLGSHSCIFRPQESQNKSYGFFSSHTAERKELQMLLYVWRESRALPCLLVSSDSLSSSSVVQRVNLNPRKCQEPHLFLHLKWEYFALFFFFF